MQGLVWVRQDFRCDPAWDMISQVGNYLKFEVGSQEGLVGFQVLSRLGCAFLGGMLLGI